MIAERISTILPSMRHMWGRGIPVLTAGLGRQAAKPGTRGSDRFSAQHLPRRAEWATGVHPGDRVGRGSPAEPGRTSRVDGVRTMKLLLEAAKWLALWDP